MNNKYLVSKLTITHHNFKNIHSAGPELIFSNPCIGYLKKGYVRFLYNGQTLYAQEGDLIYIACETKYRSIWYGSPDIEWYQAEFDFLSKYAFYDYRFQILKDYPSDILDKMCESYHSSPMKSLAFLYLLLDDIYPKMQKSSSQKHRSSIESAIKYIEDNYSSAISISELAELCHISESTLFEQFKRLYGVTPIAFKHNIMIQHAIELLSYTEMSIEEISRTVGFCILKLFQKNIL